MKIKFKLTIICLTILYISKVCFGVELHIPKKEVRAGEVISIPLIIDKVENLAGVKLVLKYDKKLMIFKKGKKSPQTASLMHIINDKIPGRLILVMAGAKGVKGENFPIITLVFQIKRDITEKHNTKLEITEIQMMSDKLKEIGCSLKIEPLIINPNSSSTNKSPDTRFLKKRASKCSNNKGKYLKGKIDDTCEAQRKQ